MFKCESNRGKNSDKPITARSIDRILKGIAFDLGLNMKVSTHTLRKTFCYHQMLISGNDSRKLLLLQKIMGHSSVEQTLDYIGITREEIREYLNPVYDLERLMSKIVFKTANPRDLLAFRNSIRMIPAIKTSLMDVKDDSELASLEERLDPLRDIYDLIDMAIVDNEEFQTNEVFKEAFKTLSTGNEKVFNISYVSSYSFSLGLSFS